MFLCRISSAGQSTCLTSMGSTVRICYPVPLQCATAQICNKFMLFARCILNLYRYQFNLKLQNTPSVGLKQSLSGKTLVRIHVRYRFYKRLVSVNWMEVCMTLAEAFIAFIQAFLMVSVAQRKSAGLWLRRSRFQNSSLTPYAGVAQRPMARVSKTRVRKHHVGSNPNHPCHLKFEKS